MTKIVILNYEDCSVNIIDFKEQNISEEDWIKKHYSLNNCEYMIVKNQELNLNFKSSTQY